MAYEIITEKNLITCYISQSRNDYVIIDVREDDFYGGNIKNAVNIKYSKLNVENDIIKGILQPNNNINTLIIHCMYSSLRGPGTCNKIINYLKKHGITNINVILLKNGFYNFINYCIKNNITENNIQKYQFHNNIWKLKNNNYYHETEIID